MYGESGIFTDLTCSWTSEKRLLYQLTWKLQCTYRHKLLEKKSSCCGNHNLYFPSPYIYYLRHLPVFMTWYFWLKYDTVELQRFYMRLMKKVSNIMPCHKHHFLPAHALFFKGVHIHGASRVDQYIACVIAGNKSFI